MYVESVERGDVEEEGEDSDDPGVKEEPESPEESFYEIYLIDTVHIMQSNQISFDEARLLFKSLSIPYWARDRLKSVLQRKSSSFGCLSFSKDKYEYILSQSERQQQQWFSQIIRGVVSQSAPAEIKQVSFSCNVKSQNYSLQQINVQLSAGKLRYVGNIYEIMQYSVRLDHEQVLLAHNSNSSFLDIRISPVLRSQLNQVYRMLRIIWINQQIAVIRKHNQTGSSVSTYLKSNEKLSRLQSLAKNAEFANQPQHSSLEFQEPRDISINLTAQQLSEQSTNYFFARLFPHMDLMQLKKDHGFKMVNSSQFHKIYKKQGGKFRLQLAVNLSKQKIFDILSSPLNSHKFFTRLKSHELLVRLADENACVFKEIHQTKGFLISNEIQSVYLRHAFKFKKQIFMFDKTVQSQRSLGFWSTKAKFFNLWNFFQIQNKTILILETETQMHQREVLNWFSDVLKVRDYATFNISIENPFFVLNWSPRIQRIGQKSEVLQNMLKPKQSSDKEPACNQVYVPFTFQQLKTQKSICLQEQKKDYEYKQDDQGFSIIPNEHLKIKWIEAPKQHTPATLRSLLSNGNYHPWLITQKTGQLIYTDKALLEKQTKVLTFVIKKMGTNILQGKPLSSISLPVTIFQEISFLERLATCHEPAPLLLQRAASQKDPLRRFKWVVVFVYTLAMSYIVMKKPFNPILGQTYMCLIDGCPYYAEQISHHPPISSYLLVGRGYRFYGSIQPRQTMGFNSATGVNLGCNKIQFSDGTLISYQTSQGEVEGMIAGDRKLRLKGKNKILDITNNIYTQITHAEKSGFFSTVQEKLNSIRGQICRLRSCKTSYNQVEKSDMGQVLAQYHGQWTGKLYMDNQQIFDIKNDQFHKHQNLFYHLASDPKYRGDVHFKKLNDDEKSQCCKQKLQVIQRNDRQLRKKYGPKKQL